MSWSWLRQLENTFSLILRDEMGQESLYHKLPDTHTYTVISLVINGVLRYHVRGRYLDDLISLEDKNTSTNKVIIFIYKSGNAATVIFHCSFSGFHCSSTAKFSWDTFFLFYLVSNSSYSIKWHCSYSNYTFFYIYIYIVILTQ